MATGRIGVTPTLGVRWSKAPAAGTTSLSGLDDNSVSLVYSVGYEQVYRNGVLLSRGNDYTATNGTTVTLTDATVTGDIIEIFANELVPLADAISKGQFTAKGSLLSATAASTPGVLAVGSNNQVLTADSSTSTGLKWATPAAGATINAQKVSANYYRTQTTTTSNGNMNVADYFQTTYYMPVYLPTGTADRLIIRTGSSFSGNATVRIGLYNNVDGLPTTVLVDGGTVNATAASTTYSITISTSVTAGWYWMATNATDSGGSNWYGAFDFSSIYMVNGFLGSTSSNQPGVRIACAYYQTGVTGAFATAGTLDSLTFAGILGMVRVS